MAANTNSLDLELSSTQYAAITDASQTGLDITGDLSFAGWVRVESAPSSSTMVLASKNDPGSSQRAYLFGYAHDGANLMVIAQVSSDGGSVNRDRISWTTTLNTGTYYHLAVTIDVSNSAATEMVLYINGVSQGNGTVDQDGGITAIFNSSAPFALGSDYNSGSGGNNLYDGLIDEVVITSDIMSAQEIADLFAGWDASQKLDNIQGYWKLNNAYTDSSGNGNTLTAVNTPSFSATVPFANYAENAVSTTRAKSFII